jgi:hypothetical protein
MYRVSNHIKESRVAVPIWDVALDVIRSLCKLALMICAAFAGQYLALMLHWGYGLHHQGTCGILYATVGAVLIRVIRSPKL